MRTFIHQARPLHPDHLVDAVGELEAAILDMDCGPSVGQVTAIDIDDS